MRQAITTKWLGPTNHMGSRVKAYAQAGSVTVHWDYALGVDANHDAAARALAAKFDWLDKDWLMVGGALPDGTGNVYVFTRPAAVTNAAIRGERIL